MKKAPVAFLALATAMVLISCSEIINLPSPTLKSINPSSALQNSPGFMLTCTGSGFSPQSSVLWNGSPRITFFQSSGVVTATINPADLETPGVIPISVFTPQPGGGTSGMVNFTVNQAQTPVPTITGLSPSSAFAGAIQVNVQVNGTGFTPQSLVTVGINNHTPAFISGNALEVSLSTTDLTSAGIFPVAVVNPPPGGGASNTIPFTITNAPPALTLLSPNTTPVAGTKTLTVNVTGSGFSTASVVSFNGTTRTTIFVAGSQLNFTLSTADQAVAGTFEVTVVNPPPGGGTSTINGFSVIPDAKGTGLPELVSIATDGELANQGISNLTNSGPSGGGNGRFSAFASTSSNLIVNDNDTVHLQDVFVHDSCVTVAAGCTPTTLAANIANDNITEANAPSFEPSISNSGQFVVFTSTATNLVIGATTGAREVFFRNSCLANLNCSISTTANLTASTSLVSIGTDGMTPANADSFQPSISPDGRYVAFVSSATNLVSGVNTGAQEVYLRDTCNGITTGCTAKTILVSTPDGMTPATGISSQPIVANDGLFVAFVSTATNLGGNTNGLPEIFLRGTCLNAPGSCSAFTKLVSAADPAGSTPANDASQQPAISNDGRFVGFASKATNLPGGSGGFQQVYLRDSCTGVSSCTAATTLVSSPDGMMPGNGDSSSPSLSNSGQFVAFDSFASNLVANDTNNLQDVFVRNTCVTVSGCTMKTVLASVASGGAQGNGNSSKPVIGGDGHFVTFASTATNLVTVIPVNNGATNLFLAVTTF